MSSVTEFGEASTFTRGEILAVDDSRRGQTLTVRGYRGELFTGVLRDQPHGLSSVPPIGATGWFERVGSSDRLRAIGFDSDKRPVSSPDGSAVLYDASENVIFAKGADGVKVRAKAGGVEVEAEAGSISLKRGAMRATISDDRIELGLGDGMKVILTPGRVDLGGEGGVRVATESGFSSKVFAVL